MAGSMDVNALTGEGVTEDHSIGRTIVMTIDREDEDTHFLRSDKGILLVSLVPTAAESAITTASDSEQLVFTGAGTVNSVINTTTNNLEVIDGTVGGEVNTLIAVLLPGMALPSPITVVTGLVLKSAGIAAAGVSTTLYALAS